MIELAPVGKRLLFPAIVSLGFCLPSGFAFSSEWDDCGTRPAEKTELACAAIIDDAARSDADHARAYVNRARVYSNDQKLNLALPDLDAALRLGNRSVPALLIRGFVSQRKNALDAAAADYDRAIEIDP